MRQALWPTVTASQSHGKPLIASGAACDRTTALPLFNQHRRAQRVHRRPHTPGRFGCNPLNRPSRPPHNSTNVQAGLDLGVQLADRARRDSPDAYNYIILMSDGVANMDATDPFAILESAGDHDSQTPLRLITIGVGIENFNDYLLEQLAQHGNGWYRYLTDTAQARATFSRENWLSLSIPFADQTRAQVTWDPNVVDAWRIVGYENRITSDESFTQARHEFAEIPAGAATTVFYELELRTRGMLDPWTWERWICGG